MQLPKLHDKSKVLKLNSVTELDLEFSKLELNTENELLKLDIAEEANLIELSETLNVDDMAHQLEKFLNDVPDYDLQYFITRLLPKDSPVKVIKDIRHGTSGGSKEENVKKFVKHS